MFNPEKMLGGLLRGGLRRGGLGSLASSGAALGLLGVAMEAVEHYMNRPASAPEPGFTPPPAGQDLLHPVPPPAPGSMPPPPPSGTAPPPPAAGQSRADDALLLIRAMIAAANADGVIDEQERSAILERLKNVQLSPEEHRFLMEELMAPKPLSSIAAAAGSPESARQVYLASLLAITVDTDEELDYLRRLAESLRLDKETLEALHAQAGVNIFF